MPSNSFAKNTKGAAGVHLVVAQLSLMGYVAMPTTRNLKSVDVVAFNEQLSQFAFIQVKSTDKPKIGWLVHGIQKEDGWEVDVRKAICLGPRFFYVFVSLPNKVRPQPTYYVVTSVEVADRVIADLNHYITSSGRKAERQRCAWGWSKSLQPDIERYKDKWDILMANEKATK